MSPLLSLALFFAFVSLFTRDVNADFTTDDVNGTYMLEVGQSNVCAGNITFNGTDSAITPEQVSADSTDCTGGTISLEENTNSSLEYDNSLSVFLLENNASIGDFLSGTVDDQLDCNSREFSIYLRDPVSFFKPLEDVNITWADEFENPSQLIDTSADNFTFMKDAEYFMIADRCLYVKSGTNDINGSEGGGGEGGTGEGTPDEEGDDVCFHSASMVHMADGSMAPISLLQTADIVQSGVDGIPTSVVAWTHKGEPVKTSFVNATTAFGSLVATTGHYVYVAKNGINELVRMMDLTVGMNLVHHSGAAAPITSTTKFVDVGVWNPQTETGSIVVNGFVASCYTETIAPPMAHALLSPVRAAVNAGLGYVWNAVASTVTAGWVSV